MICTEGDIFKVDMGALIGRREDVKSSASASPAANSMLFLLVIVLDVLRLIFDVP